MSRARILLFILFTAIYSLRIPAVSAHGSGLPFVKLNNEYTPNNILLRYYSTAPPKTIPIGADIAPTSYLVNDPITFSIDEARSPFSAAPGRGQQSIYQWTYGDGSPPQRGTSLVHRYMRPGTYIATLEVKLPVDVDEFTTVDTVQIDILPSKDYVPPVAIITANGKTINPSKDSITIPADRTMTFDGAASTGSSLEYLWDFGDGTSGSGKTVRHQYKKDAVFPLIVLLRATDYQHIASDTFAYIIVAPDPLPKKSQENVFTIFSTRVKQFLTQLFGPNP